MTKRSLRSLGLVVIAATIPIALVAVANIWRGIPVSMLTADPAALGGVPPYAGFLSQLGIFFWAAAATTCLLSIISPPDGVPGSKRLFFLWSAALTLLLAIDDVFMLHDGLLPYFGVPQIVVLGVIGLAGMTYVAVWYRTILHTEFAAMAMALAAFALSVGCDVLHPPGMSLYLLEDGAKFVGQVAWLAYFVQLFATPHRAPSDDNTAS